MAENPTIKTFVRAFGAQWFTRMSGPLTVPFTAAALFAPQTWQRLLFSVLAILCAAVSAYGVWANERTQRNAAEKKIYDGRPLLVLGIYQQPGVNNDVGHLFTIENCGSRSARWVEIESIESRLGNYRLYFDRVRTVLPQQQERFGCRATKARSFREEVLVHQFFTDNPPEAALVWFDPKIRFRDTDESVMEDIARICFDVQTNVLYVAAVPYTQKHPPEIPKLLTL